MKFRKVEISAFRIYNKPEDSIFDFTSEAGEIADFVSLFAPNGFGKTSFYDAVEWGITGSINRFFIRNKELNKLETAQSLQLQNKIPLLRNSKLERDTYVRIYSDSSELPIEKKLNKSLSSQDLMLKRDAEPHDFHKVILSQEWISAFLTEKDGEDRYRKFMEIPELSSVNNYYTNIKLLLSAHDAKEKKLQDGIFEARSKIAEIRDNNLLDVINSQIDKLNSLLGRKEFQPIEYDASDKQLIEIRNQLAREISECDSEVKSLMFSIEKLRNAKAGNDSIPSMDSYITALSSLPETQSRLKEIENLLEKFKQVKNTKNEVISYNKALEEVIERKKFLESLLNKFEDFHNTRESIALNNSRQSVLLQSMRAMTDTIQNLQRDEIDINIQLKNSLNTYDLMNSKKVNLPIWEASLIEIEKSYNLISARIESSKSEQHEISNLINRKTELIKSYTTAITELNEHKYSIHLIDDIAELKALSLELSNINISISEYRLKLQQVSKNIEDQQNLQETLQDFIEQGLVLANESKSSKCPLCEHLYADFETLAEKITNHSALNNPLKNLLHQKQQITDSINKCILLLNDGNKILSKHYADRNHIINSELSLAQDRFNAVEASLVEDAYNLKSLLERQSSITTSMQGKSLSEYALYLDSEISDYKSSIAQLSNDLSNLQSALNSARNELEKQNAEVNLSKDSIDKLLSNPDYIAVREYFNKSHPNCEPELSYVTESIKDIDCHLDEMASKIQVCNAEIARLQGDLSKHSEEDLLRNIEALIAQQSMCEKNIGNYTLFFKDHFDCDVSGWVQSDISSRVDSMYNSRIESQSNYSQTLAELLILEKNSEHISEFLQTENAKRELQIKEDELLFLSSCVRPSLEEEKNRAKEFLEGRIKDFFFEELINKLYAKIDPHPQFKSVEFRSNLDSDNPRLDVFVKTEDSECIIPNLYFSTAQINILSLCIFLASALKSSEYNCIFIDDPIQSMDSINVLSTIDLLRSIVINHNKQIIISTHDENFHNLLRKKMPTTLFKSKYLRLESFGKVVADSF